MGPPIGEIWTGALDIEQLAGEMGVGVGVSRLWVGYPCNV